MCRVWSEASFQFSDDGRHITFRNTNTFRKDRRPIADRFLQLPSLQVAAAKRDGLSLNLKQSKTSSCWRPVNSSTRRSLQNYPSTLLPRPESSRAGLTQEWKQNRDIQIRFSGNQAVVLDGRTLKLPTWAAKGTADAVLHKHVGNDDRTRLILNSAAKPWHEMSTEYSQLPAIVDLDRAYVSRPMPAPATGQDYLRSGEHERLRTEARE